MAAHNENVIPCGSIYIQSNADKFASYVIEHINETVDTSTLRNQIHDLFRYRWKEINISYVFDDSYEQCAQFIQQNTPKICEIVGIQKEGEDYIVSRLTRCLEGCQNNHPRYTMSFSAEVPITYVQIDDVIHFNCSRVAIIVYKKPTYRFFLFPIVTRKVSLKIDYVNVRWSLTENKLL